MEQKVEPYDPLTRAPMQEGLDPQSEVTNKCTTDCAPLTKESSVDRVVNCSEQVLAKTLPRTSAPQPGRCFPGEEEPAPRAPTLPPLSQDAQKNDKPEPKAVTLPATAQVNPSGGILKERIASQQIISTTEEKTRRDPRHADKHD